MSTSNRPACLSSSADSGALAIKTLTDHSLHSELHAFLQGRVCIVGVGNRHRKDDGAGPRLIDQRRAEARGIWLDAGVVPENLLEPIAKARPDCILIVDAVSFGGRAGDCCLLDPADADMLTLSTHAGSLATVSSYLMARCEAHVRVLAIQPGTVAPGDDLSEPVVAAVERLADVLSGILGTADPVPTPLISMKESALPPLTGCRNRLGIETSFPQQEPDDVVPWD